MPCISEDDADDFLHGQCTYDVGWICDANVKMSSKIIF